MSFSAFYLQLFTAVPLLSQRSHWALFFYWLQYMRVQLLPHVTSYFPQVQLYCWLSFLSQYSYYAHAEQEETHVFLLTWQQFDESGFISIRVMWPVMTRSTSTWLINKGKTSRHNCHKLCMSNQTRASLTKHFKVNIFCKNGVEWAMSLKKFRGWNSENIQLP